MSEPNPATSDDSSEYSSYPGFSTDFDRALYLAGACRLSDLKPSPLRWLWPNRIPLGRLTLLVGDPGLGKSLLTLDIAARLTRGKPWPEQAQGARSGEHGAKHSPSDSQLPAPRSVLLLTAEDGLNETVYPRLEALGADTSKVISIPDILDQHFVCPTDLLPEGRGGKSAVVRVYEKRRDVARLHQLISEMPDCRLVIVDPITAFLGDVNEQRNSEVRSLLRLFAALARRHNVAFLAVSHLRKKEGAAVYRTMGSLAFVAAARAAWAVTRDPTCAERRLFIPIKNNLARDVTGLAFTIESDLVSGQPIIRWSPDPIDTSAESVIGNAHPRGRRDEELQRAIDWLQSRLATAPCPTKQLKEEAEAHGISYGSLRRAFVQLRGVAVREGSFPHGHWTWKLPAVDAQSTLGGEFCAPTGETRGF